MKIKLKTVLCCGGPKNGDYINSPSQTPGLIISPTDCWPEGNYELVEWPETKEIVAYWRPADASD